jgi:hypothetical protein
MTKEEFRKYVIKQGYKPMLVWELPTGYYARINGWASTAEGFSQILQGGTIVRLSFKDIDNPLIIKPEQRNKYDKI